MLPASFCLPTPVFAQSPQSALAPGGALSFLSYAKGSAPASVVILMAGIAVVAILAAMIAIVLLIRARSAARKAALIRAGQVAKLENRLMEAEFFANASSAIHIIWQGKDDAAPRLSGALPGSDGVPASQKDILDFKSWLDAESFTKFNQALGKLKDWGTPFNLFVQTRAGASLEADGRATGERVAVRLRDLAGKMQELAMLSQSCNTYESDARSLRTLLDTATAPAWLRDEDGALIWVNQAYAEAVEAKTPEDAVDGAVELFGAADRQQVADDIKAGESSRRVIHAIVRGERRSMEVTSTTAACGSAGLAVDITRLDELQDEIRRHIQANERTLDQLESAVAIFGSDQKLQYFNAACVKLWGLEEEWLRSAPGNGEVLDRLRVAGRLPDEVDYHVWKKKQLNAFASVEAQENWWYLPDGRTLRVVSEPHAFGGVTWLFEDVTEQHRLESRYKTLVSVQRETLDHLREGVALFGSHGRLQLFNPALARIWELEDERLNTLPHIDQVMQWCLPLYDKMDLWGEIKAGITTLEDKRETRSWRISREDGRVLDVFLVPLPAGSTLLAFVDETASARAEDALRQRAEALEAADRIKSAFVSHVSYQLREPLTSIIGFNQMLASGTFGEMNEKQAEYVDNIGKASATLENVINDILDLATIDAGVMELELNRINIAEALQEAGQLVKDRLIRSKLHLEIDISDAKTTIIADGRRLKQILFNLLSNAISFSPPDSKIEMRSSVNEGFVTIQVKDQGCGIDPGLEDKVFDRFESDGKNAAHRGAGLGLAIVKGFVELHDGSATLSSRSGTGTVVTCRFPINGPAVKTEAAG